MGVVDDDAERLCCGEVCRQPVQPVQHRERGVDFRRRFGINCGSTHKTEQTVCGPGPCLKKVGALELREIGQRRLEELTHDSESKVELELGPTRSQHAHPAVQRSSAYRCKERGLTDAG